jgi:hypothetical protein
MNKWTQNPAEYTLKWNSEQLSMVGIYICLAFHVVGLVQV